MTDGKKLCLNGFFSSHLSVEVRLQLASLAAGGGAGVLTTIAVSPFDVLKTRFQVQNQQPNASDIITSTTETSSTRKTRFVRPKRIKYTGIVSSLNRIVQEEGIRGLYRGFGPAMGVIPLFWGVYFSSYKRLKHDLANYYTNGVHTAGITMAAAGAAGAITDFITNPLWVVRTRMQTQHMWLKPGESPPYKTTVSALMKLLKEEGIVSWFRGLTASIMGLSHVMVQFPIYEQLKLDLPRLLRNDESGHTSQFEVIIASSISKIIACAATYPHEVLRARLQFSNEYTGLIDCFRKTVQIGGFKSLYQGLLVNIIKTTPACAITFVSYEWIMQEMLKMV